MKKRMNVILTIVFVIVGIIGIRYGYQYGYQFAKNRNVPKPYVLTEDNGRKIGVVLEFTPSRHQGLQFVNYVVFREDPQREFMGFRNEDVLKNITYSRKIGGKVDSRIVGLGEKKETVILTDEQKLKILERWNDITKDPPSIQELLNLIFSGVKDGRSPESIAIKKFLSEQNIIVKSASHDKRDLVLTQ